MKYNKKSRLSKPVIILTAVLLLIAAAATFYLLTLPKPTKTNDAEPQFPNSSEESSESIKDSAPEQSGDQIIPETSEQAPQASTGSISIVVLNQENGYVNARADVSNFETLKCVYQFSSEGARPIVRESSGSCAGISINQNEFEKIGTYTVIATAYNSAGEKITTSRTINVT